VCVAAALLVGAAGVSEIVKQCEINKALKINSAAYHTPSAPSFYLKK
jgi:hypothetical protein